MTALTFYEFFAGGGMARAGLGECWRCVFANDVNPAKSASYTANWGGEHLKICDVADLTADDIPERVSLSLGKSALHARQPGRPWQLA